MVKKITAVLLVCGMLLAGCSNTNDPTGGNEAAPSEADAAQENTGADGEQPDQDDPGEVEAGDDQEAAFSGNYMVDAAYAISKVGDDGVILIDARGEDDAKKGTLDGAIGLTWQALSNMDGQSGDEMWGTVLPAEALQEALGSLGLDKSKEIILFADADKGWGSDGRILWTLRMAGYQNLVMVDGGIEALKSAGAELVKSVQTLDLVEVSVDAIDNTNCINTAELLEGYDQYTIVDARAQDEYDGATKYGEAAGGHLPGAVNVDYVDLFKADGTLKSNDDIVSMFAAQGITPDNSIITYCTAGIRSAYMQLVLEMCGFDNVKNYDESFYRWSAVEDVE